MAVPLRLTLLTCLVGLAGLSGCLEIEGEPLDASDLLGDVAVEGDAASAHATAVRIVAFTANATGLSVLFALDAAAGQADASGNVSQPANATGQAAALPVTWELSFGDGNATNGTSMPAQATHTYGAAGSYNATLTVRAGDARANRTLAVNATSPAAPTQAAQQLSGTVSCLPTAVLDGELAGDTQTFVVEAGQTLLTLTLAYSEDTGVEDLDMVVTDAAGKQTESAESGPEPSLLFESPAAGEWTLQVIGYSCALEASYTADLVFGEA